ncbi:polysaccharide biosynthesis/export family protein [Lyngbya aestuarii]|uniref:polysaccharide biosynthesis/export family protein n=1 Tax=Lyngbya aestuarii TaxID=118322 RepID=UPI00403E2AF8
MPLSGTLLFWLIAVATLANVGSSQTLVGLPTFAPQQGEVESIPLPPVTEDSLPDSGVQLPSFTPPAETLEANPVPPPLGYPEQQWEVSPPAEQFSRYRLGPGDTLQVQVQNFPDLSFSYGIDIQGNIVVPLLGKLPVAGLTVEEVQEQLRAGLNRFVIDPEVTVVVAGFRPAQVTVTGEVFKPGYYALNPGAKLDNALLAAGGATNEADLRTIVVRRRSLVDGSISEKQIDLFTPLQNGTSLPDLRLQDGDAVIVLKLDSENTNDYDRTLAARSSFAQPSINIRVLNYAGRGISNLTLPNGSNFVDALAAISPNANEANLREIALIRFDPERGKALSQEIDGKRALLGDVAQNVPLQNNDVIVVGRNLIARITYALSVITRPFRDFLGFSRFFERITEDFGINNN